MLDGAKQRSCCATCSAARTNSRSPLHLDFQRRRNRTIRACACRCLNQEKSPAGRTSGVLIMLLNEVEVSPPAQGPAGYIGVDLSALAVGDIVAPVGPLKLPAGVEIPELRLGKGL